MRLQEVLKEREAEISAFEETLKEHAKAQLAASGDVTASPETADVNGDYMMSPKTAHRFAIVRESMESRQVLENGSVSETDESLDRLNELML
jgi:hypothetical protein